VSGGGRGARGSWGKVVAAAAAAALVVIDGASAVVAAAVAVVNVVVVGDGVVVVRPKYCCCSCPGSGGGGGGGVDAIGASIAVGVCEVGRWREGKIARTFVVDSKFITTTTLCHVMSSSALKIVESQIQCGPLI